MMKHKPLSRFIASSLLMACLTIPHIRAEKLKDDLHLVEKIRALILKNSTISKESAMKDYQALIPKTGIAYDMVAIKGGDFLMGSPADEKGRKKDEGPQHKVEVEPFWIGKYEVTWDQFDPFKSPSIVRNKDGSPVHMPKNSTMAEIVSAPTTPYMAMDYEMGKGKHPVVNMTQHAASKFCQWLSAQTGHYYRLPTEAEWEYACRAGTKSPYSFGKHLNKNSSYAVFDANQYSLIGTKKPNPWGLYDMHGNVAEWCLDQYYPDSYQKNIVTTPATKVYPRVARGGSWYDFALDCRSATRLHSNPDWQMDDAQLPASRWYLTDAQWLGFRIVRPLKLPSAERMFQLWNSDNFKYR